MKRERERERERESEREREREREREHMSRGTALPTILHVRQARARAQLNLEY